MPLPHRFVSIDPLYTPTADGKQDNIFITKSYDATTHFETVAEDVADVWERITVSTLRKAARVRSQSRAKMLRYGVLFSATFYRARSSPWRRATSRSKDKRFVRYASRASVSISMYTVRVLLLYHPSNDVS